MLVVLFFSTDSTTMEKPFYSPPNLHCSVWLQTCRPFIDDEARYEKPTDQKQPSLLSHLNFSSFLHQHSYPRSPHISTAVYCTYCHNARSRYRIKIICLTRTSSLVILTSSMPTPPRMTCHEPWPLMYYKSLCQKEHQRKRWKKERDWWTTFALL